jgi:hypothetical protein
MVVETTMGIATNSAAPSALPLSLPGRAGAGATTAGRAVEPTAEDAAAAARAATNAEAGAARSVAAEGGSAAPSVTTTPPIVTDALTAVPGVVGSAGGVDGANVGPWSSGIRNVVDNGTFTQCGNGSCVSATAQVLTNGAVTEKQIVAKIGEWADPTKLPSVLNELAPGATPWRGGYFVSAEDALAIASRGPMGAVLQAPGSAAHMVTISPISGSNGLFRVQDTGVGKTYDVPASWIMQYVVGGVWK